MKLSDVFICLDCDEVYKPEIVEFLDQRVCLWDCPSCGSHAVTMLCRWLSPMNSKEHRAESKEKDGDSPDSTALPVNLGLSPEKELT